MFKNLTNEQQFAAITVTAYFVGIGAYIASELYKSYQAKKEYKRMQETKRRIDELNQTVFKTTTEDNRIYHIV